MSTAISETTFGLAAPGSGIVDKYQYAFAPRPSRPNTATARTLKLGRSLSSTVQDSLTLSLNQVQVDGFGESRVFLFDEAATCITAASRSSAHSSQTCSARTTASPRARAKRGDHGLPPKQHFQESQIVQGLSQLGRTADGLRPAYLRLCISNTTLSSEEPIAHLVHLQSVELSCNQLTSVRALGKLRYMTHLDLAHNQLRQVLEIKPTAGNLRTAVYSHNSICHLNPTPGFERLASLKLDHNHLEYPAGLGPLPMLSQLDLSHNRLLSCKGLKALGCLRELDLSHNRISSLQALRPLSNLQVLAACHNQLQDLAGVEALGALRQLDVSNNQIGELECMAPARHASLLSSLNTAGNPLEKAMSSRLHMVYLLPQLTLLNGEAVDSKQKVHAANLHGADAEQLRLIRRRCFPNGELDDGGGATPPPEAGFVVSRAEEEQANPAGYSCYSSVAAAGRAEVVEQGLLPLAEAIAAAAGDQLGAAYGCFEWVVKHVTVPGIAQCRSVDAPLFPAERASWEAALLAGVTGTWAERASWLFVHLCRACELDANMISGTWRHSSLLPGERLAVHNHCWAAVKVNGRWRLLDVAHTVLLGGHAPFFVPPEAFIYTYYPMQAHWQLLDEPISMDAFWELPPCTLSFFSRGLALMSNRLRSVNTLSAIREGEPLPAAVLSMVVPVGLSLAVSLLDSALRPIAAGGSKMVFQQPVLENQGAVASTACGTHETAARVLEAWVALPSTGEFYVNVQTVAELPGHVKLDVAGRHLALTVRDVDDVLRVKVVVPPVEPHDYSHGMLVDAATPACMLPLVHDAFYGMQLLYPPASKILEADRMEVFRVLAPGAIAVAVGHPSLGWTLLQHSEDVAGLFAGEVVLPRSNTCQLVVQHPGGAALEQALTLTVMPQQQHMVALPHEPEYELDWNDNPQLSSCRDFFQNLDANCDGLVTRKEMIQAFRRNRQYADHLRMPHRIRAGDGTLQRFNDTFLTINTDRSGAFNFTQFATYYQAIRGVHGASAAGSSTLQYQQSVDDVDDDMDE